MKTQLGKKGLAALLLMGLLLTASGCSDSSSSRGTTISLVEGQEFQLQPGDELKPDDEAEIRVRHDQSTDNKFVTLLSGNADLVRWEPVSL